MRFGLIAAESAQWPTATACRVLGVSRAGFHAWKNRSVSLHEREDRRLGVLVREAWEKGRQFYGSPRIHMRLLKDGEAVSRKRVIRLMQQQGIKARVRRRFKNTTDSNHTMPVAPNLLKRQFEAEEPNQRWVGDTTELRVGDNGRVFLAAIVDLFSRQAVGWALSAVNDRHLVLKALGAAVKRRCPNAGLLHHSDRGSPYASDDYQKGLEDHGIVCSMSGKGNCYDNAAMESFFSTLKSELGERFESYAEAKAQLFDYIEVFYNQSRMHSSIGYMAPAEFERAHRGASA